MISWREWRKGCVDLIFPVRCPFCKIALGSSAERAICSACQAKIHYLQSPLCACCGREMPSSSGGDHLCGDCLRQPPVYARARAVVHYEEPVSHLLHRLKYVGDTSVLPTLTEIMEPFVNALAHDFHPEADRVVPVPLFPTRLKKRGLNQSLLLARIFFPVAGEALLIDSLIRTRNTLPQTSLDGAARKQNLRKAFAVQYPDTIKGRRVFLVDDVLTTGTTVAECGKALLAAGALEIYVVTVARVAEYR
jgi:ComF family protein